MATGWTTSKETAAERKDFQHPDEVRSFEKGKLELLKLGGGVVGRLTLEPGWRWSQHVGPLEKTSWCQAPHTQYQLAGRLHIRTVEGDELETRAGDVTALRSGHDAWVVGDEAVVLLDWTGAAHFAQSTARKSSVGPRDPRGGVTTISE